MESDPEAAEAKPEQPQGESTSASEITRDPLLRAAAQIPEPPRSEVEAARTRRSLRFAPGQVLAKRYRLEEQLGQGGMGVVWAATHLLTGGRVAIKCLLRPGDPDTELRRRFLREARAATAVDHPNVVRVFDVIELEDETPIIVMELLSGETLRGKLDREGKQPLREASALLAPVAAAVATAHDLGIVHRDLKPENIVVARNATGGDVVKVLDFGIAKLVGASEGPETESITAEGSTLGTPCYMAPEQTLGQKDVDHRADIWALGVILYESLAGTRPLRGSTIGQIVMALTTEGIRPLDQVVPTLPPEATALVMRMLQREREARQRDTWEVHEVLARFARGDVPEVERSVVAPGPARGRRSQGWLAAAAAGIVGLGTIAWVGSRLHPPAHQASAQVLAASATANPVPPALSAASTATGEAEVTPVAEQGGQQVHGEPRASGAEARPKHRGPPATLAPARLPPSSTPGSSPAASAAPASAPRGLAERPPF
jgi:hypothetical protein